MTRFVPFMLRAIRMLKSNVSNKKTDDAIDVRIGKVKNKATKVQSLDVAPQEKDTIVSFAHVLQNIIGKMMTKQD